MGARLQAQIATALVALSCILLWPHTAAAAKPEPRDPARAVCNAGGVRLDLSFDGGTHGSCRIDAEGVLVIRVDPEDAEVTNCSPWYAARIYRPETASGPTRLTLEYAKCDHRYKPWYWAPAIGWTPLEATAITTMAEGRNATASIDLPAAAGWAYLSAQPVVGIGWYENWIASVATRKDTRRETIGYSRRGRPIEALTITQGEGAKGQILLVSGQHPPETTGTQALQGFLAALLADEPLATRFRAEYDIVVVPLVNPDGVTGGFWRHNTGSTDLNRDWGPFTQPETRAVRGLAERMDMRRPLRLFLDFHSTNRDVIYTMPSELPTVPAQFTRQWLQRYDAWTPGYEVEERPGHNSDRPVSKGWFYERFKIPAATYEVGDDTSLPDVAFRSGRAAQAAMEVLLDGQSMPATVGR